MGLAAVDRRPIVTNAPIDVVQGCWLVQTNESND